jgi:formylglycine-generating enzyme required for sulfatase activity
LNDLIAEHLPDYRFCIPNEAQWEYAAIGGKESKGYRYSGSNNIDDVAFYSANSAGTTCEVGKKDKNELGFYDMSGNVWEWCRDRYNDKYYGTPFGFTHKVQSLRGSSWDYGRWACNTSTRTIDNPEARTNNYGFRLCLEFQEEMSSK